MIATDFLSAETMLVLPSKRNPKVYLAIGTKSKMALSFQLYNPFSIKGRLYKGMVRLFVTYFKGLAELFFPVLKTNKTEFMRHIEAELGLPLTSSVYLATAKDKVVLQLVHEEKVFGYLKFPLTNQGVQRLVNEREAIKILSAIDLIPTLLYSGSYDNTPFIILKEIKGSIGGLKPTEYRVSLKALYKNVSYDLSEHPRVLSLEMQLAECNEKDLLERLKKITSNSNTYYKEVYEHGDFAPWNLIRTSNGIVPFDFEFFVAKGLEFMDELKYYYQIERLLNNRTSKDLITAISSKVSIPEFDLIFQIFLIKEILIKVQNHESSELERSLLDRMNMKKNKTRGV